MDDPRNMTKIEAFFILFDTALLLTLAISLIVNAVHQFRKHTVLLALLHQRSVTFLLGFRTEKLLLWLLVRLLEFVLFLRCVYVAVQRARNVANAVEARILNGGKFRVKVLVGGRVDERAWNP